MVGLKILLLCVLLLGSGCVPLTPEEKIARIEEREWRQAIDLENWLLCEYVYRKQGVATLHMNHNHDKRREQRQNRIDRWAVRRDLRTNSCRSVLRDYWIHY